MPRAHAEFTLWRTLGSLAALLFLPQATTERLPTVNNFIHRLLIFSVKTSAKLLLIHKNLQLELIFPTQRNVHIFLNI